MSPVNGYIAKDGLIKEKPRAINRGLSVSRNTDIVLVRPFAVTMLLQDAEGAEQNLDSN
jgi:hypothetical protein